MELQEQAIQMWDKYSPVVLTMGRKVLIALLIIIGGKILIQVSKRLAHKAVSGKAHADETFTSVFRTIIQYVIIIICVIMILDIFGVNTAGLIALLGAAGVAVGFALKDTLGNIAAGIVILFLRPFKKGDYIDGGIVAGTIKEIGIFVTILETPDGVFISAPNSTLWGVPLKNYSRNPIRRLDVTITISYTDSIETAFQVLQGILNEEKCFLKEPAGQVLVQSLGDVGTNVSLRGWVKGAEFWPLYWAQMKNVKEKIQAAGLTIALPRREMHIVKENTEQKSK